jgi:hypothetical protein
VDLTTASEFEVEPIKVNDNGPESRSDDIYSDDELEQVAYRKVMGLSFRYLCLLD